LLPGTSEWSLLSPFANHLSFANPQFNFAPFVERVTVQGIVVALLTALLLLLSHTLGSARRRPQTG
jgi:hypothetical protein